MSRPPMTATCADVEALLPLIADGAIDAASDPAIFDHLSHCDDCQEALARHDLIGLAIGAGIGGHADPLAPIRYRLPPAAAWATAAALLAALVGLGSWQLHRDRSASGPVAQREVIRVTTPGDPAQAPYYLIRDGHRLDPAQLELGDEGTRPAAGSTPRDALPVGLHY